MKTINIIIKSLLILGVAIGLSSCNKYEYEEMVQTFKVLETNYSDTAMASEASIRVNEEGFTIATDSEWLKAELAEATLVKVLISKNTTAEARTANVILEKDGEVQRVPIMQMGLKNYVVDFEDTLFKAEGETKEFTVNLESEPTFTLEPEKAGEATDWLSYELKDGKLILTATAIPKSIGARMLKFKIEAGPYVRTILVSQKFTPAYEDVIGTYTLDYYAGASWSKDFPGVDPTTIQRSQAEVTISEGEKGKSFILKGLAYPITLIWNPDKHSVSIFPADLVEIVKGKKFLVISISGNGYKKVEDGKVDWGLYAGGAMEGFWKDGTSSANLRFDFPPCKGIDKGKVTTAEVHGLLFWIWEGGFKGRYDGNDGKGIGILSDFFLVKKS